MIKSPMQFIDLRAQHKVLEQQIKQRFAEIFNHGQYIHGPEVTELEEKLAEFVGAKHCISVANGTDALMLALMAIGVGPGDEVIVPDFTFIAPAEAVSLLGAKVVFSDIDPDTYNMNTAKLESLVTANTKAIIPVGLFGQCSDMESINQVAAKRNIAVIEDAAQTFGATYRGRKSCNLSTIACTSFFPSKPLGCYGDGGACFTNDDELAIRIREICNHGMRGRYNHVQLGINSRLDTMQAAVLLAKLTVFPQEIKRRNELAAQYNELLKDHVKVPIVAPYNNSVFAQYTIGSEQRDKIQGELQQQGIPTAIHYPKPLHAQIVYADRKTESINLPNSLRAAQTVISLPFSAYLSEQDLLRVAQEVKRVVDK